MTLSVRAIAGNAGIALQGIALAMAASGLALMMVARFPSVIGVAMAVVFILADVGSIGSRSRRVLLGATAIRLLAIVMLQSVIILGGPGSDPGPLPRAGAMLVNLSPIPAVVGALLRAVDRGR